MMRLLEGRPARVFLAGAVLLLGAALLQVWRLAVELGVKTSSTRWMLFFALLGSLELLATGLLVLAPRLEKSQVLASLRTGLANRRLVAVPLAGLLALAYPAFVLSPLPAPLSQIQQLFFMRLTVFWLLVWAGTALLGRFSGEGLGGVALFFAAVHQAAVFLPDISAYPFSLGWSEGSRFYYASLFYADRIYGQPAAWTVLHPSRYWLQSLPFLLGELPLWAHRLWQVVMWIGFNALAAWLLVRRLGRERLAGGWWPAVGLWAFLFMFQGPIWYHLVVMVAIVLWGADVRRFWRTLLVVLAASLWAGVSRVNWIPLPAALAALLYLLETPQGDTKPWQYFSRPFFWGLAGAAAGFLAQSGYVLLSGNTLEQFGSSFTSDLLWYRLFPSATFPLGVLPGILLAGSPVFLALFYRLRAGPAALSAWRWAGIAGLLLVFLAGGLVVSVKIGGGSNLHNMDAFLATAMVLGAWAYFGRIEGESGARQPGVIPAWVLAAAVLIPIGFALSGGDAWGPRNTEDAQRELAVLEDRVGQAASQGGEVLFIAERHLLTMHLVRNVPLVEDYEKVFLMEMAMAGNRNYLERFRQDIQDHRFSLIVSDYVNLNPQSSEDVFGEENNAWDQAVSVYLVCYYETLEQFEEPNVVLLTSKQPSARCLKELDQ